jgi:hypothetical protein
MFGPSLKSVPGCLVSIVPMLIGLPVAFTPGLGPQLEVFADPPLEPLDAAVDPPALPPDPPPELLLLLLLPQPATRASAPTAPSTARTTRMRGTTLNVLTDRLLSSSVTRPRGPPRWRPY